VWLVEESECPFATLHSLMNYEFEAAKQSVGEGKVRWSDDKQTMLANELLFESDCGYPDSRMEFPGVGRYF
jgi:hypothetical protein